MTKTNNLGITLKKLRESRKITIIELAVKSETGNGTIGNIERGANKASVETLEKISKALNLTFEERMELFASTMPEDIAIKMRGGICQ